LEYLELTCQYKLDIQGGKGPASALFINPNTPKPVPGRSQALVKVKAFGLNRMDIMQREGKYPLPPQAPSTMGVEFSGIIESLGESPVNGFKKGDAVFGLAYGGMNNLIQKDFGANELKRSVC
jgi:NADPH:quinone reductase-like Zn-dependent oxidoreductase